LCGADGDNSTSFPVPVCLQDYKGTLYVNHKDDAIIPLAENTFYLQSETPTRDQKVQTLEIKLPNQAHELVVACCSKHLRLPNNDVSLRFFNNSMILDVIET
jgi:hypothetical protein